MSREIVQVKVKKLSSLAKIPEYQTRGAAAFDIRSINEGVLDTHQSGRVFSTGLSFEIPEGHVMLVFSRSGHGFNHDTSLSNCVGVIDSDYRGELMVKLTKDPRHVGLGLKVNVGDRIAQGIVLPIPEVAFSEATELSETERGVAGLGSTGVA